MNNYVVCENPEHDRFGHRKQDCSECNPHIDFTFSGVGRTELISLLNKTLKENVKLRAEKLELSQGLHIKGWWCICNIFNGEEKEIRTECRSCGIPKTVRQ